MPSPFGDAWRSAYQHLDKTFGDPEGFRLDPMRPAGDANGRPGADPARLGVAFIAIFDAEPEDVQARGRGRSGDWTAGLVTSQPQIDAPASSFMVPPRVNDVIVRLSTGEKFVIASVGPSDLGRLTLKLNRA